MLIRQHLARVTLGILLTMVFVLSAAGLFDIRFMDRLEAFTYDLRLRVTMSDQMDNRIVVVDIDEKSLAVEGRWPWRRDRIARMMDQLVEHYGVSVVGFDVVFAEKDESSGLAALERLGQGALRDDDQFRSSLVRLRDKLDYDAIFARSIKGRPIVLGYYFTNFEGTRMRTYGEIPQPVLTAADLGRSGTQFVTMTGYGSNLPELNSIATAAGHFTPFVDQDGVCRRVPCLVRYKDNYYESLSVAMVRTLFGAPPLAPGFPDAKNGSQYRRLEWLGIADLKIPVDEKVTALVPYRGKQGSYRYISATDVINGKVPKEWLEGAIVLIGTTAPGLMDLRSTPVSGVYPGVEIHANMIAGILDQNIKHQPAYMMGAEVLVLVTCGLLLTLLLPVLNPFRSSMLFLAVVIVICVLNGAAWNGNIVMPLASSLTLVFSLYVINMSYGFFQEARTKKQITGLFGQYVHPELVSEMSREPDRFTMESRSLEMTVIFSDVCGFTAISEQLSAADLSLLMNEYLSAMTEVIQMHRGTIDKYIGDAIMAFWGAPLDDPQNAEHAVLAALEMQERAAKLRQEFTARGWPELRLGIGANTGIMSVGNMGSKFRMAYTVMGDAVNLASRLEGLTRQYGVGVIVGEDTCKRLPDFVFRELDRVRVKGRNEPVVIYEPLGHRDSVGAEALAELELFSRMFGHYLAREWGEAVAVIHELQAGEPDSALYRLYATRLEQYRQDPPPPEWDGVFTHKTKS